MQFLLLVLYFLGATIFAWNIYAFYTKKSMRFRSLVFDHPQDKEMRGYILFVSIIALIGCFFAFFELLHRIY